MFNLDLTKRQMEAFNATLRTSHRMKAIIHVLDESEKPTSDFNMKFGTTHLLEGAVQVDATQDVTRSLSLTFLDPMRRFKWSPDHTHPGSLYTGDFLSVHYAIQVRDDNRSLGYTTLGPKYHKVGSKALIDYEKTYWVAVPVFTGPLVSYEANGPEITIECQGKESLVLDPMFANEGYKLGKHERVDDAMQEVLRRIGERSFHMPSLPWRLGKDVNVHPTSQPWLVINGGSQDSTGKNVPGLVNHTGKHPHHAFYDAAGRFTVKRLNKDVVFRFYNDTIIGQVDATFDTSEFKNHIVVTGSAPKGKGKKPVKAELSLPRHNPNSPWKLARNGKPRYLTMRVTADNLKTEQECMQRAHHLLNHHSQVGVTLAFDALPIPMLEPHDVVRVKTEDGMRLHAPVKQFTIPLTSGDSMSVGYNKKLKGKGKPGGPKGQHHHHHNKDKQDG